MPEDITFTPSDMFMTIIVDASTYGGITCQCGIDYLCIDEDLNPYPEEIEAFEKQTKENPEKYIGWDHPIGMAEINGRTYVEGCSCNYQIAKIEKWIDSHEHIILEYFTQKQKAVQEKADTLKNLLSKSIK